jgi:hypothetical protein
MKNISIRLVIALLTFATGIAAFALWLYLRSPHSNTSDSRQVSYGVLRLPQSSEYENPAIDDGLFSAVSRPGIDPTDGYDERVLVISYTDIPVEPQASTPDAPTIPGFYLSSKVRLDFERVAVIGNKVYFRTRSIGGISYEFSGISGEEVIPHSDSSIHSSFIKGILTRLRDGEIMAQEEIKFRHAVVG